MFVSKGKYDLELPQWFYVYYLYISFIYKYLYIVVSSRPEITAFLVDKKHGNE